MDDIDRIGKVINHQKGEITALLSLLTSIVRALPIDQQAKALAAFDTECEVARTVMLNSKTPDDVLNGFDLLVKALDGIRLDR